jgi:hypothetical protein
MYICADHLINLFPDRLIPRAKSSSLDNYDSFTYNLVHYVEQFCDGLTVRRNDAINLDEVAAYDAIILSPGPGLPKDAGIMPELIHRYASIKEDVGRVPRPSGHRRGVLGPS